MLPSPSGSPYHVAVPGYQCWSRTVWGVCPCAYTSAMLKHKLRKNTAETRWRCILREWDWENRVMRGFECRLRQARSPRMQLKERWECSVTDSYWLMAAEFYLLFVLWLYETVTWLWGFYTGIQWGRLNGIIALTLLSICLVFIYKWCHCVGSHRRLRHQLRMCVPYGRSNCVYWSIVINYFFYR